MLTINKTPISEDTRVWKTSWIENGNRVEAGTNLAIAIKLHLALIDKGIRDIRTEPVG